MIIAILMAGGKGERLKVDVEKPLFKLDNLPLIDYVINNLKESSYVQKIVIAVSPNTSNTLDYLKENHKLNSYFQGSDYLKNSRYENLDSLDYISYLETPGDGYLEDLSFILATFEKNSKDDVLLFINADLPLLNSDIIDYVLENYEKSNKAAFSVLVPIEIFERNGLNYSYDFNGLVPSGLNIVRSENVVQEEEQLIIPKLELAFNINTLNEASKFGEFK